MSGPIDTAKHIRNRITPMPYDVISAKTCPYVQRVTILLREKEVEYRHITIDLKDKPDWFAALSPFGKVPLLKLESGQALFESQVINEFIEEAHGPGFHPADPVRRAGNRAWIELISSIIMSYGGYYYAEDEDTMNNRLGLVHARLSRLEGALGDGPYFNGDAFSLVDAAAAPMFARITLLDGYHKLGVLDPFPKVAAWAQALAARPSVQAVVTDEFQQECIDALKRRGSLMSRVLP